jgi:DNA-binding XRE family transcriptional regulator
MVVGPTTATSTVVRDERSWARGAQRHWLAARPARAADGLRPRWLDGYPWIPGDDPTSTLEEARLLLGDGGRVTICADLDEDEAPLVVTQVHVLDIHAHSTGPTNTPWLRVSEAGTVFGVAFADIAWLRSGSWGLDGQPGDPEPDPATRPPPFPIRTAPSRHAREAFETLVGVAQARYFSEHVAITMSRALQRLLAQLTDLGEGDLEEIWSGEGSGTSDGGTLITSSESTIRGAVAVWRLRADFPSDNAARVWACGLLADLIDRILLDDAYDIGVWWADAIRERTRRLGQLTTLTGLLAARRRQLRLTREGLAAAAGVHVNSVAHWELGDSQPARQTLPRLARGLQLPQAALADALAGIRDQYVWPLPDVEEGARLA